jgi:hypothetical protein
MTNHRDDMTPVGKIIRLLCEIVLLWFSWFPCRLREILGMITKLVMRQKSIAANRRHPPATVPRLWTKYLLLFCTVLDMNYV